MEFSIREAQLSDLPYIYDICLRTGNRSQDATDLLSDRFIIGQYFAVPYLHFEIDTCFVLVADHIPVGYMIGTSSTLDFNTWMNESWLPNIRKIYPLDLIPKSDLEKFILDFIHKDCPEPEFVAQYPGHLHIDLLPIAQKKGFGKKLMNTFMERLREKGSSGVHLHVGESNTNAFKFYKRLDFMELKRDAGAVLMGKLLV